MVIFLTTDVAFAQLESERWVAGQEYREAIRSRGIQSDIIYQSDVPDEVPEAPEPEPEARENPVTASNPEIIRWIFFAVLAVVLILLVILVVRNGAGIGVSLSKGTKDPPARRDKPASSNKSRKPAPPTPAEAFLQGLLQMADRREALHKLLVRALANSASLTGLRPGRSWTARDVIRAMPEDWPHLPALRQVAGQAEIAWFGGRDVEIKTFEACIDLARPIIVTRGSS